MDGRAEVHWEPNGYAALVNDPAPDRAHGAEPRARGRHRRLRLAPRATASEDFSYFAQQAPGLFFFVGVTPPGADRAAPANHSPRFRVDEAGCSPGLRATLHLVADFSGSGAA